MHINKRFVSGVWVLAILGIGGGWVTGLGATYGLRSSVGHGVGRYLFRFLHHCIEQNQNLGFRNILVYFGAVYVV